MVVHAVIPATQEAHEFKVSLGYKEKPISKISNFFLKRPPLLSSHLFSILELAFKGDV